MADRLSLFSVPPCVTRLVPLAVLVAGFSAPVTSLAGQKVVQKASRATTTATTTTTSAVVVEEALSLEGEGDKALAEGRLGEAVGRYAAALQRVPGPSKQRQDLVAKFASASVKYAEEQARNGQIDQATLTLNAVLDDRVAPGYKPAVVLKEHIQDADRFNPAQTPAHVEATKKVRDLFTMAQGYMDSAQFKAAEGCYNQILAEDPTNTAARRGLERVEREINNYLQAARDHTHIKMLNEVDRQWESPVLAARPMPGKLPGAQGSEPASGYSIASRKMQTIVMDKVGMADTPIRDALIYLVRKSRELDTAEVNPDAKGVNIIFNPGSKPESSFPTVTLDLKSTTLGEALKSITGLTGTRLSTEGNTITVSPIGEGSRIEVRRFRVAPGFLTKSGTSEVDAGAGADPFAAGGDKSGGFSGLKISRVSAQDWLTRNGIPFPEGTGADYIPADNVLVVRNTEENLALVDTVIESATDKTQRQVLVTVTMLKAEQRNLEELGYDWLMGQTNLGDSGIFASGGTVGNTTNGSNLPANYSIVAPNGVATGALPITAGLRGASELTNNSGIDDLIASGTAGPGTGGGTGRSPGILGVAGVFTDPQMQVMMRGLNQKKGIDISTAQKLILKAGQRATAASTRQIPYPTEFDPPQIPQTIGNPRLTVIFDDGRVLDSAGSGSGIAPVTPTTPQSFEFKDTGSTLDVEATVGGDGHTVDLSVSAVFSEFDGFINYGTPITSGDIVLTDNKIFQPVFSKVAVNTPSLSIADGSTITLGGLSQGQWTTINDKVPLLGDIPFIGRFFRSDVKQVTRKAVIYFIKVQVIDPGGVGVQEAAALAEKAAEESAPGGR